MLWILLLLLLLLLLRETGRWQARRRGSGRVLLLLQLVLHLEVLLPCLRFLAGTLHVLAADSRATMVFLVCLVRRRGLTADRERAALLPSSSIWKWGYMRLCSWMIHTGWWLWAGCWTWAARAK